jgi:hypothetical protein
MMSYVPDYRGVFLRGLGSQMIDGTEHTSAVLGDTQSDTSRKMDGRVGSIPFYTICYGDGGTNHPAGSSLTGRQPFYVANYYSNWYILRAIDNWPGYFPRYKYYLSGSTDSDGHSNYSLIENTEYPSNVNNASAGDVEFDVSRVWPVSNEFRPVNKAVRYFIKAK